MSRVLASVTNVEEAMVALECGADILDLKNPAQGALGALPLQTIRAIVEAVGRRRPVSATVGDLPMQPGCIVDAVNETAATGVDIVKVGFFGREGHADCLAALRPATSSGVRIVAVLFADTKPDLGLIPLLAQAGFHGVMLDTAIKNGRRLGHHLSDAELQDFVDQAQALDLLTGLAGSLAVEDLSRMCSFGADYLGFRGALCSQADRNAGLERARLCGLLEVLYSCNRSLEELTG